MSLHNRDLISLRITIPNGRFPSSIPPQQQQQQQPRVNNASEKDDSKPHGHITTGAGNYGVKRRNKDGRDMLSLQPNVSTLPASKSRPAPIVGNTQALKNSLGSHMDQADKNSASGSMMITGHTVSNPLPQTVSVSSNTSTKGKKQVVQLNQDLSEEAVSAYLQGNPHFLDSYVLHNTPLDRIESWVRRLHQKKSHRRKSPAIYDVDEKNNCDDCEDDICKLMKQLSGSNSEKSDHLHGLSSKLQTNQSKKEMLLEVAACCSNAVGADDYRLYLVDEEEQEGVLRVANDNSVSGESIGPGRTFAAYIASTKQVGCLSPLRNDDRFPLGIPPLSNGSTIQSALAIPVFQRNQELIGVIEMYRVKENQVFTKDHQRMAENHKLVADLLLFCKELYQEADRQKKLNEFLLNVTKSIFQDIVSMDTVIMKIMNYAKHLVTADRSALFLVDQRTKELYARVFDMGDDFDPDSQTSPVLQKEIRFPMNKGVAGFVASTGKILNIPDAYQDARFNRAVDQQTGYKTKTILCMPILIRGTVMGVVQMVNKLEGIFTKEDEEAFEIFAIYCGLALHHAKLYEKIRRSEQKYKVALEVLSYHAQASEAEVKDLHARKVPDHLPDLERYQFSPWSISDNDKPLKVIYMFRKLFDTNRLDMLTCCRFVLTVRKNYRAVPYHNWQHAFSVAHAVFTIITTSTSLKVSNFEKLALFVACLCHDLDHRGKTNSYMVKSSTPIAALYGTSTMEHHHFNQTVAILQNEGHNIFTYFSSEEYKQVLGDVKHCILATDLALFFPHRAQLRSQIDTKKFSWTNKEDRRLVMAMSMTASDLCAMYKSWEVQVALVQTIMEEFYVQGDEERAQGIQPIPMMDRTKKDQLPQSQVGFIIGICLPCYELVAEILPEAKPIVEGAKANLKKWQEMADRQAEADGTGSAM